MLYHINMSNIKNKGTGAGGAQTNINGKKLENRVRDIVSGASKVKNTIYTGKTSKITGNTPTITEIKINNKTFIRAPETMFERWEKENGKKDIKKLHGTKRPDDCLINLNDKLIIWIECKVQKGQGSKCEVLQTAPKKIRNLKSRFPNYTINYIYILDSYYKKSAEAEIDDLDKDGIPYIFDNDPNFEQKIIDIIK